MIARRAESLVGRRLRQAAPDLPDDCTGVARAAYRAAGIDLMELGSRPHENGVTTIYRAAKLKGALHRRKPRAGDLVFFRETRVFSSAGM